MLTQYNQYNFEADFKSYLLAENIKPATLKNYLSDLRHFFGWVNVSINSGVIASEAKQSRKEIAMSPTAPRNDNENIGSLARILTIETLENYKQYLTSNNLPLKTVNRRLSTLRKFCSFCISQGWMKENPAKKILNVIIDNNRHSGKPKAHPESDSINQTKTRSWTSQDDNAAEYILKKYETLLVKEGLGEAEINKNITDVKEFLQFYKL